MSATDPGVHLFPIGPLELESLSREDWATSEHAAYVTSHYSRQSSSGLILGEGDLTKVATAVALLVWDSGPDLRARHASCSLRFPGRPWCEADGLAIAAHLRGLTKAMDRLALFDVLVIIARSELMVSARLATSPPPPVQPPRRLEMKDLDGKVVRTVEMWGEGQNGNGKR